MATTIRLKRIGRRNRPFYRVIVIDSRKRRDGAAIEELGWYNPIKADDSYKLNEERIFHWLKLGAQVSDTVHSLLQKSGVAFKWHLMCQGLDEKAVEKELQKWQLKQAQKAKQEVAAEKKKVKAVSAEEEIPEAVATEEDTATENKAKVEAESPEPESVVVKTENKKIEKQVEEPEKTSEVPPKAEEAASVEEKQTDADVQHSSADDKVEEKQQAGER